MAHELAGEGDKLEGAAGLASQAARDNNAFPQGSVADCAVCAVKATANATDAVQGMIPGDKFRLARATAVVAWEALQQMRAVYSSQSERNEVFDEIEAAYNTLVERKLGRFPELGEPARLD